MFSKSINFSLHVNVFKVYKFIILDYNNESSISNFIPLDQSSMSVMTMQPATRAAGRSPGLELHRSVLQ